jgi:hypothetical protein
MFIHQHQQKQQVTSDQEGDKGNFNEKKDSLFGPSSRGDSSLLDGASIQDTIIYDKEKKSH